MDQSTMFYVNIAQQIDPGSWIEKTGHDIVGLPHQSCGNDCGIFMLMYTLSIITSMGFEFQEVDMPLIRKWWCLLLMERFNIEGHGQRFAFWTDEARKLLKGIILPVYRVAKKRAITEEVPVHVQAVADRDEEEKRLVDFIVRSHGAEQHLLGVLNGKPSKWFPQRPSSKVPVYLDSEEQQNTLFAHLKSVLQRMSIQLSFTDEVEFILSVLFPEAITYGLAALRNLSLKQAEQVFICGPVYHHSEVEDFNQKINKQLKKEGRPFKVVAIQVPG
ncbi:PWWP domain-containing protein MUM1L1-like isoform X1 [Astyanax mexicanus]|uniref:PWWP domain-containing protein MUM1L1-like isoform X1 n=1 Tax=Astyanax mexicanus TaxID=7994 RepID=A0A8T2LEU0_ASTMX|nr:PWWP domain-containing protein MUM1L1-like isoform X1 [Astyanax mexicanus]